MINEYIKAIINNNGRKLICLFINSKTQRVKLQNAVIFNKDPAKTALKDRDVLKKYLNAAELATIGEGSNLVVSDYAIFHDDTIGEVKLKVFFTLKSVGISMNMDSFYIYSNGFSNSFLKSKEMTTEKKEFDIVDYIYRVLSNNRKNMVTWDMLCDLFLNCGSAGEAILQGMDKKMYYFYDDLNEHRDAIGKLDEFYIPLSHYLTTSTSRLSFVANPETLTSYFNNLFQTTNNVFTKDFNISSLQNKFFEVPKVVIENTVELLSTNNAKCLYDFDIDNHTLYFHTPFDINAVLPDLHNVANNAVKKYIIDLYVSYYFPNHKDIYNDDGTVNREKEAKKTKEIEKKTTAKKSQYNTYFNKLETSYFINSKAIEQKNKAITINQLNGVYYQDFPFVFPCESIFKKVKTNQMMPYSKYNPGLKQENINRLYVSGVSYKGQKVPYLNKSIIQKLNAKSGTKENVMYYFRITKTMFNDYKLKATPKYTREIMEQMAGKIPEGNYELYVIIYGDSSVSYNFSCNDVSKSVELKEINFIISTLCNPVLLYVKNELVTMGPVFNVMASLTDSNFDIQTIHTQFLFENLQNTQLDYDKYLECVSKFISKQEKLQKVTGENRVSFMYKRISNYTKLNAIESSIIQLINVGYGEPTIVKFLMANYSVEELEAKQHFLDVLSQINVERSINPNRRLRIKNNPGLNFDIVDVPFSNNLIVEVANINSFELLSLVKYNTWSILTLLSKEFDNDDERSAVNSTCKKSTKKKDDFNIQTEIKDTTAVVEKAMDANAPSETLVKNLLDAKMNAQAITFDDIDELQTNEALDDALDDDLMDLLVGEEDSEGLEDINDEEGEEGEEGEEEKKGEGAEIEEGDDADEFDELDMLGGDKGANIDGMSLTNPNPFFNKMNNLDPKLFLKKKTGQFNAYSRMCPWNVKRQPVILTQEELDKIDREHPGSYNKKIKYGSTKDNQHYYICPRYWCLKDNVSLTEEEVKAGACGGVDAIIPKNAKKVPPGKYIFEFHADAEHKDKDGSYIEHYPGFLSGDKHPDGLCIPCCFKTWDSDLQKKRRKECLGETEKTGKATEKGADDADEAKKSAEKRASTDDESREQIEQADNYIIGVDKSPLPSNRWGMLPVEIQTFLNINNNDCFENIETHKLKSDTKCILRQGIELSQNKSFIGALANVYASFTEKRRIMSINAMSKHIASAITLDHFIEAQNGSLVSMFFSTKHFEKITKEELDKYKSTTIYKLTDFNNLSQYIYIKRAISAFNKFRTYLKNEKSFVDHEIVWDLVCMPNPNLFVNGLNLVILNIPDDDMTSNVEIMCPSNAYSSMFYNSRKFTFILIKKNEFYEPVYTYEETPKAVNIQKLFNEFTPTLLPKLKEFIQTIKDFLNDCQAKQSMEYSKVFERSNKMSEVVRIIQRAKGTIDKYVVNTSKKIVGIIVDFERKGVNYENVYIPCLPTTLTLSNLNEEDIEKLITYDEYVPLTLSQAYKGVTSAHGLSSKLNTKPYSLVSEDGMIVGIVTNTNQFVPVEPIDATSSNAVNYSTKLKTVFSYENSKLNAHLSTQLDDKGKDEIDTTKGTAYNKYKLSLLEQKSFQRFRNKIKVVLQTSKHQKERETLETIIASNTLSYNNKMEQVIKLMKKITKGAIEFYSIDEFGKYIERMRDNEKTNFYYVDDIKKTLLPKSNLNEPSIDNSIYYYERITDELIRFSRIYDFLLNNQYNVGYLNVGYNLRENELLIPSSELDQSFYQDISAISDYYDIIYSLDFYNAQPQTTPSVSNVVTKKGKEKRKIIIKRKKREPKGDTKEEPKEEPKGETRVETISRQQTDTGRPDISNETCKITKSDTLRSKWKTLMGSKFKSNIYEPSVECSYKVIIDIIKLHNEQDVTVYDMRVALSNIYKTLTEKEQKEILSMLSHDGKIEFARKIKTKTATLEQLPLQKDYYLSLPDMLLLAREYKLPLIIITSGKFKSLTTTIAITSSVALTMKNGKPMLPSPKSSPSMEFFILKQSGVKRNEPFIYELFVHYDDVAKLNLSLFKEKFRLFLESYLENIPKYKYEIVTKTVY